ncbi:RluA family pseudouridine synthase [Ehrlichia ruminantium]|uniref:Pseudouridine synthase n=1 Tax=Ehrlichia ruminantium TaxID=779 RepID=A0AAE6QAL4_EHRRU|nr:RluA family pseudouridine synthase [Ehrlichia ruminantium]QGR02597.1 RluA family pseudouridine synthase [Ehrlichia ruminantium]QGR03517.1 RluA family pseudouridine synthase [Ehrlichia ruminantium]QGR04444.1 RluA family pseudouridine synthase [Ehrlichia ruminantium]
MFEKKIFIQNGEENKRLDKFIAFKLNISRNKVQQLIQNNKIYLFNKIVKDNNHTTKINDLYHINIPIQEHHFSIVPNINIPITVLHEDQDIIIINKAPGLTVHPGAGTKNDTLVNGLVAHYGSSLSYIGKASRPGIVHRLDKDTSGLMVIAKNEHSYYFLSDLLLKKQIKKEYIAVVWGVPNPRDNIIKNHIDRKSNNKQMMTVTHSKNKGKLAITEYNTTKIFANIASLVKCRIYTGRTHQIRVHMSHIGNSIIGDQKYGKNESKAIKYAEKSTIINTLKRQALHAHKLGFIHPTTNTYIEFNSDIPKDIQTLLNELEQLTGA